jgi:hypothetical protein
LISRHHVKCLNLSAGLPALRTADALAGILALRGFHVMNGAHDVILGAHSPVLCHFEHRVYT